MDASLRFSTQTPVRPSRRPACTPKRGAGADQRVFEFPQVLVEILAAGIEIENRIADQLAGAVIGRLAAAVDFVDGVRQRGGIAEGGLVAQAADGVNGLVL